MTSDWLTLTELPDQAIVSGLVQGEQQLVGKHSRLYFLLAAQTHS